MLINSNGVAFIKAQEGLKQYLYVDKANNWTIGWGHYVSRKELQTLRTEIQINGGVYPLTLCEGLLSQDIKAVEDYLNIFICKRYAIVLNQNQFNALGSFCFNLGHFTIAMQQRFLKHDLAAVGEALLEYTHDSKGNVEPGLIKRRQAEFDLFVKEG